MLYADSFLVFCILQGSGATSLRFDEKYDINFVSNFMENTRVKKLKIGQHLSQLWTNV